MREERIESTIKALQITQELRAKGYNAEMRRVNKNGLDILGIEITEDNSSSNKISSVYYPNKFDGDTREIADQIIENYKRTKVPKKEIVDGMSKSFEEVKDKLIICLEPVHDADYITERYLDLQLYIRYRVSNNMSAKATKDLADIWGASKKELISAAIENTRKKIVVKNLSGMLVDFEFLEDVPSLVFCGNDEGMYGAGYLALKTKIEELSSVFGRDLYILPSSIHEVLVLPDNRLYGVENLKKMVKEVNDTEVSPEERLSYSVYKYSRRDAEIKVL